MKRAKIATERDLEIMQLAGMDGLASFRIIKNQFFELANDKTARARLTQMEKAGWIQSGRTDARQRGELVFFLTDKGHQFFTPAERQYFMQARASEYKQQLMLQEARLRLKQEVEYDGGKILEWKNEHQLKSEWRKAEMAGLQYGEVDELPDAEAIIELADGSTYQIGIEADGSYFGKRLSSKCERFGEGGNNYQVMWVTTPDRANKISNAISAYPNQSVMVIDSNSNNANLANAGN